MLGMRATNRVVGHHNVFRRGYLYLEVIKEPNALFADGLHHALEHDIALALVLHQRVPLRHRPQADAFLEVIHLVKVLLPLPSQDRKDDATFKLTHAFRADSFFACLVDQLRVGEDLIPQELDRNLGLASSLINDVLGGDRCRVKGLKVRPEAG